MPRQCKISGKRVLAGNNVSHAHNKTRMKQAPNLHKKRIYVPELDRTVRVRVSAYALRTITKIGLMAYLKKRGLRIKDIT